MILPAVALQAGMLTLATDLATDVATDPTRYIFSFGDSYTSTGFDPAGIQPTADNPFGNPPFPGTTTSGGPNWIGELVQNLSPPNTLSWNFAYGGATVNKTIAAAPATVYDFVDQRDEFLQNVNSNTAQWNADNSIFVSYFGTNDINVITSQIFRTGGEYSALIESYFGLLQSLYDVGARRFVVFQMDPLDRTPLYLTVQQYLAGQARADIVTFNNMISTSRDAFVSSNPDAQMSLLDTMSVFNEILDNPQAYGSPDNMCSNLDGTSCLWWNDVHPGQAIQTALANQAFNVFTQAGFYDTM